MTPLDGMGAPRARAVERITLAEYASFLERTRVQTKSTPSLSSFVRVSTWSAHPRAVLASFADARTHRRALGRLAMFLEDPEHRGRVPQALPSGARGGVANYSGHNARVRSVEEFCEACGGVRNMWAEERALVDALVTIGAMSIDQSGRARANEEFHRVKGDPGEACVLAVCATTDVREAKEALIHEAMHGLWYVKPAYARACYEYYASDALSDSERAVWVEFLRELRYAVEDEEVVVNEFQAYMATETQMFGRDAVHGRGGKKATSANASAIETLTAMQVKFAVWARNVIDAKDVPFVGGNAKVVWM